MHKNFSLSLLVISLFLTLSNCVDPVAPEFDYENGVIFIDANATTKEGASSVKIERSIFENGLYRTAPLTDATVFIENVEDGRCIPFLLDVEEEVYVPAPDFSVRTGEQWRLLITMKDGKQYESKVEEVTAGVPVDDIFAVYNSEVTFSEGRQEFIPGHRVSIRFSDPAGAENYYLWRYKTFEQLGVCKTCERGRFRNGECEDNTVPFRDFDYTCEVPCWFVRFGDAFQLFDDQFADGRADIEQAVAILPLWNKGSVLIQLEQIALSASGYEYYQIINDVANESSGLNAPPPASLLGNLFNPDDRNEVVLGQFNAVALEQYNLFIERAAIQDQALTPNRFPELEDPSDPTSIFTAPCEESKTRTSIRPNGWK